MKKLFALVFGLMCYSEGAFAEEKENFYLALSTMSDDLASYTFMIDQILELKCGKVQSIQALKKASETQIYVLIELNKGNSKKAKEIIASIPCEK